MITSSGLTCPQCSRNVGHSIALIGIPPLAIPIKYTFHIGLTFKIALKAGKYTLYGSFITDNIDKLTGEDLLRKLLGEEISILEDTELVFMDKKIVLKQKLVKNISNITNGECMIVLKGKIVELVEKDYEANSDMNNW